MTRHEVTQMARDYYAKPGNGAGGSLHIVLDDGNIKDDSVEFCRKWAEDAGDEDGVRLAEALLGLSKTQRLRVRRER